MSVQPRLGLAIVLLTASYAEAQSPGLALSGPEATSECATPQITYFTPADGKPLETSRLEFSPDGTARWTQRAFLPDGTLMFESEARLQLSGLPTSLSTGATVFQLAGTLSVKRAFQGIAGGIAYAIAAEGADLSGIDTSVRLEASHPEDKRSLTLTPKGSVVTLRLSIHNSPCVVTWVWGAPGASVAANRPVEGGSTAPAVAPRATAESSSSVVNALIVQARKAYDRASSLAGDMRAAALREALDLLKLVIDRYPTTDQAVTLIGGGEVAGVSVPTIERMMASAAAPKGAAPAQSTLPATPPASVVPARVPVNIAPSGWQQAPQYRGQISVGPSQIVLHGAAWTNGRLQNGNYDGNRVVSAEVFDFSAGGDAYMQFSVNAGGKYLGFWPRVLEGVSVLHVTTDHSWANSVVVPENQPLFAHLRIEPDGAYRVVLATGSYDNRGGTVIYFKSGKLANSRGRLELQFGDNYAGTAASITITAAMVRF